MSKYGVGCGYHYLVRRNGVVEVGRMPCENGAHARGVNSISLGVCLIGRDQFSKKQHDSLKRLIYSLKEQYPYVDIIGHSQVPSAIEQGKTCPNFNVAEYLEGLDG